MKGKQIEGNQINKGNYLRISAITIFKISSPKTAKELKLKACGKTMFSILLMEI